jgi:hypothetical protein
VSGGKLILLSITCAFAPVVLELLSVGPSNFGDPETGYALVFSGFLLWPLAVILCLIGLKRLLVNTFKKEKEDKR